MINAPKLLADGDSAIQSFVTSLRESGRRGIVEGLRK